MPIHDDIQHELVPRKLAEVQPIEHNNLLAAIMSCLYNSENTLTFNELAMLMLKVISTKLIIHLRHCQLTVETSINAQWNLKKI